MYDMQNIFTGANFVLTDKRTGKTFFEMKRKTPTRPDGTEECYYIFKFYEENMPSEEDSKMMHEAFERFMCPLAAEMGIGMFSFDELSERCAEQVKRLYERGGELKEEQIDVIIKMFDHAIGVVGDLVVGVSTKLIEGRDIAASKAAT